MVVEDRGCKAEIKAAIDAATKLVEGLDRDDAWTVAANLAAAVAMKHATNEASALRAAGGIGKDAVTIVGKWSKTRSPGKVH